MSHLEVADIFRAEGQARRQANMGHISLGQLKVMSAIEACRSAALGGHVLRCSSCAHQQIAYNSSPPIFVPVHRCINTWAGIRQPLTKLAY
jgi:hypothetical protein